MYETFRLRRHYLHLGMSFAAIVAVPAVACLCGVALPDRPIENPLLVSLAMSLPWFGFCGLGLYMAVAYVRRRLRVDGPLVAIKGVLRTKSIDLSQVTLARWFPGCVKLDAAGRRMTIWIADYEADARDRLIAHLHHEIAPRAQRSWLLFERRQSRFKEVGPDQVELNRKRLDRCLMPGIALCFLATVAVWWTTGEPRHLVGGFAYVVLLVALRYAFPKRGHPAPKIRTIVREKPEFKWFLWWCGGGWLLFGTLCLLKEKVVLPIAAPWALGIAWIVGVLVIAGTFDRGEMRLRRALEAEWQASCSEMSPEPTAQTCSPAAPPAERGKSAS